MNTYEVRKLIDVVNADCEYYVKVYNKEMLLDAYMYLQPCTNSNDSGLYQLIFNGCELWYGTLQEINAVVKSMIKLIDEKEKYFD